MAKLSNMGSVKHRETRHAGRLLVHDAEYRVVVVKNPTPAHEDDVVHAHCIEQSLSGRGRDVAEALADLAETVTEMISEEYLAARPEYEANEDKLLIDAFERKSDEFDGCQVIRRGYLRVRLERVVVTRRRKSEPRLRTEEISFMPQVA